MTDPRNELSPAGERRRERMLPLLQDAIRHRVRRRRQRRAIACSLLLLAGTIGLVELFEGRSPDRRTPETMVADRGERPAPMEPATERVETPVPPAFDIQSFNPEELFARALERDPDIRITTPTELRADLRTTTTDVVVAYVSSEELMMELSLEGMSGAVVCSVDRCTLRTVKNDRGPFVERPEADDREL